MSSLSFGFLLILLFILILFILIRKDSYSIDKIEVKNISRINMEKIIDSLNELDIDWVKLKKWYVRQAKIQSRKQRLNLPIAILFFIVLNTANILFLLSYLEEKKEQLNRMVRYDNSIIIDDIGGMRSDHTEERKKIDDIFIGLITFAFFFTITFIQIYPFIFFRLNHYLKEVKSKFFSIALVTH